MHPLIRVPALACCAVYYILAFMPRGGEVYRRHRSGTSGAWMGHRALCAPFFGRRMRKHACESLATGSLPGGEAAAGGFDRNTNCARPGEVAMIQLELQSSERIPSIDELAGMVLVVLSHAELVYGVETIIAYGLTLPAFGVGVGVNLFLRQIAFHARRRTPHPLRTEKSPTCGWGRSCLDQWPENEQPGANTCGKGVM